jgi:hypothetical protein
LLFGALLCGWLTVRLRVRVKKSPCMQPADIHEMSRQLSRIAYLVLYAVIGIKLCISIVTAVWGGGHSLLDAHFLKGPGGNLFDTKDDYQMCLAAGLIAMAFVRVMVLRLSRRVGRQSLAR